MNIFKKMFPDGDIKTKGMMSWGTYKGFHVSALQDARTYGFTIKITYHTENGEQSAEQVRERVRELFGRIKAEQKQLGDYAVEDNYIRFVENSAGLAAATAKKINSNVDRIIDVLREEGCVSGCELCGNGYSVSPYNVNNMPVFLCSECEAGVERDMEQAKDEILSRKSNLLLGVIGAVAASVIGVALWVLIYQLGYIAGIAGAAIMLLAFWGYRKLGHALDTKGVLISFAVGLVMVFVASHISWTIEAMKAYSEYYDINMDFFYMYKRLFSILERLDIVSNFVTELAMGYGLSLLVALPTVISAFKESRGSGKIKKL